MRHLTAVPSDPDELRAFFEQLAAETPTHRVSPFANGEIALPTPPETVRELTVRVALRGASPPIWRRLAVAGDTTLDALHEVLQIAMGWTDSHLHRFYPGSEDRGSYFVTDDDLEEGDEGTPEMDVRVDQVLREPGDRLCYEYDFGDGWIHDVRLESVTDLSGDPLPRCPDGRMACPPEDVGGISGYEEVVAWHRAGRTAAALPPHVHSVERLVDRLPDDFDPDAFDATDVDLRFRAADMAERLLGRLRPELVELLGRLDPAGTELAMQWVTAIADEPPSTEDVTAATHHWRVLLDAIGDGVKLTSAGYLPPAVVQQMFDVFSPGEWWPSKGNRENHTPPVARLREAAQRLGLVRKVEGELSPTASAQELDGDPAGLFAHVADRLPLGKAEAEQEAGWFALLGLAAGASDDDLHDGIAHLLTARGGELGEGEPLSSWHVHDLTQLTIVVVIGPEGCFRVHSDLPAWVPRIATQILVNTEQS
ncbi:MAG: plasmid pRiA4b ORF-3 family protein [Actinomycetota bacterium]|nr:plasmid pRiA4b ORF-3 family protein [Actinomycetota bacterium]